MDIPFHTDTAYPEIKLYMNKQQRDQYKFDIGMFVLLHLTRNQTMNMQRYFRTYNISAYRRTLSH